MEYIYSQDGNYEDYASGRVIYGGPGIPNFPVRLINEMFGRAMSYLDKKSGLTVYDPCCGGGYSLTIMGLFYSEKIGKLYGSDVDESMVEFAKKNMNLLSMEGLKARKNELEELYRNYGKISHKEAIESVGRFERQLCSNTDDNNVNDSNINDGIATEIFSADCTKELPKLNPDIIITDVPYGNMVTWKEDDGLSLDRMLSRLAEMSDHKMILALSSDKKQKIVSESWRRLERHIVGKRKFEILCSLGTSSSSV